MLKLKLFCIRNRNIKTFELENSFADDTQLIAGIDEVGRGALAGPVVVGIVIFQKRNFCGCFKKSTTSSSSNFASS